MVSHLTEQEAFWAGEFGDNYVARNAVLLISPSPSRTILLTFHIHLSLNISQPCYREDCDCLAQHQHISVDFRVLFSNFLYRDMKTESNLMPTGL